MLLQVRADDAQLAGDIGAAGADLMLAGNHVEFIPGVAAIDDALGAQDHAVSALVQGVQGLVQVLTAVLVGRLLAPAREHLVGVVVMVVVMMPAGADTVLVVVVLTQENLTALEKKSGCGRVIIEYNGMWLVQELYDAMPDNWLVYQCLATADGTTIKTYAGDSAMRSLLLDKIRGSELLVVNRAEAVNDDESRQLIHKLVRQASRRCDIAYEFKDGSVAYDDIPDPLPFDIDAPVIEIPEEFFGVWYMDCMDDPKKYDGKTVKYLAQVCQTPQAGKGAFVPGRFAMTCCVQDIQFVGMPCKYDDYKSLEQRSWITITAKINVKYHPIYKGQTPDSTGPVLTALSVEPAEKPAQDVVMFS